MRDLKERRLQPSRLWSEYFILKLICKQKGWLRWWVERKTRAARTLRICNRAYAGPGGRSSRRDEDQHAPDYRAASWSGDAGESCGGVASRRLAVRSSSWQIAAQVLAQQQDGRSLSHFNSDDYYVRTDLISFLLQTKLVLHLCGRFGGLVCGWPNVWVAVFILSFFTSL